MLEGTAARLAAERGVGRRLLGRMRECAGADGGGGARRRRRRGLVRGLRRAERALPRGAGPVRRQPGARARDRARDVAPVRVAERVRASPRPSSTARTRSCWSRSTSTARCSRRSSCARARAPRRSGASTRGSRARTSTSRCRTARPARASAAGRSSCCRRRRSERVRFERSWRGARVRAARPLPGAVRLIEIEPEDGARSYPPGSHIEVMAQIDGERGGAALLARRRRAGGRRLPDRGQAPPGQPRRLGLHARPRRRRPAVGLGSPEPVPARLRGTGVPARGGRDRHHPDRRHGVRPGPPRRAVPAALRRPSARGHAVRGRALRAAR